jgi:hypothetical protein
MQEKTGLILKYAAFSTLGMKRFRILEKALSGWGVENNILTPKN